MTGTCTFFFKNVPKIFIFDQLSDKKKRLKMALHVSKLAFSPIVLVMS